MGLNNIANPARAKSTPKNLLISANPKHVPIFAHPRGYAAGGI